MFWEANRATVPLPARGRRSSAWQICVLVLGGCGASTGDLTGQVLFKGQPLHGGTVTVLAPDQIPRQGGIGEGGLYDIKDIPVGESKILVVGVDSLPDPSWPKESQGPQGKDGKDRSGLKSSVARARASSGEPYLREPGKDDVKSDHLARQEHARDQGRLDGHEGSLRAVMW